MVDSEKLPVLPAIRIALLPGDVCRHLDWLQIRKSKEEISSICPLVHNLCRSGEAYRLPSGSGV